MTAQGTITSFSLFPKPPPYEAGQPFPAHFNKTTIYVKQHVPESEHFFTLGHALFLRNVSQNHTYATMPSSMRQLPDGVVIKYLQKIAAILNVQNPWAQETLCQAFQMPALHQDIDQPLKDLDALAEDIRTYSTSLHHSSADFTPTIKFENEYQPTAAVAAIRLFFGNYVTFDPTDLQTLQQIVDMPASSFSSTANKLMAFLNATYPHVPRLPLCKDVLGMIILIHENYNSINSQHNIQGNIQQCILNYGVTNNDSPADLANEIHGLMHNAHKLRQIIDKRLVFAVLKQHFQDKTHIDAVIRTSILSLFSTMHVAQQEYDIVHVIRLLQGLTIPHACPAVISQQFVAATATAFASPSIPTPSQIHAQQLEVQQGLRSANPSSADSRRDGQPDDASESPLMSHICRQFLKHKHCSYGLDCKFLHVANPGALPAGAPFTRRSQDPRPYRHSSDDRPRQFHPSRGDHHQGQSRANSFERRSDTRSYHDGGYQDRHPPRSNSFSRDLTPGRSGDRHSSQDYDNHDRQFSRPRRDLTPARVGFQDEQRHGSRTSQSPHHLRDSARQGQRDHEYRRAASPRPNIKHHDQRNAEQFRSPSAALARNSTDGTSRFYSSRHDDQDYMDMRPHYARQQRTDTPYHGDSYNQVQRWQTNMSQTSFAQAAPTNEPFQRPSSSRPDDSDVLTNFFQAVSIKPASSPDTVHGRMLRVGSPTSTIEQWEGTLETWLSIAQLHLSDTVDIVHLLQHSHKLQSWPDDDNMLGPVFKIFQVEQTTLSSENQILPWIIAQTKLLQQHLETIYNHDLLPPSLKIQFCHAIQVAGDLVYESLADQISRSSSDSDDDDLPANSFEFSYSNDPDLQNLLKLRPSEAYAEEFCSASVHMVVTMDQMQRDEPAVIQQDSPLQTLVNEQNMSVLLPDNVFADNDIEQKQFSILQDSQFEDIARQQKQFSISQDNQSQDNVIAQTSTSILQDTRFQDILIDPKQSSPMPDNMFPINGPNCEQYKTVDSIAMLHYCSIANSNSGSDIQLNNFLQASSQLSSKLFNLEYMNDVTMLILQDEVDAANIFLSFRLFQPVYQSTSWFQLRLTASVVMDKYDTSHTYSKHINYNLARLSDLDLLIHCEQLLLADKDISYNTMTDSQLLFYCGYYHRATFSLCPQDLVSQFLPLERCLQLARPDTPSATLTESLRYSIMHAPTLMSNTLAMLVQSSSMQDIRKIAKTIFQTIDREQNLRPISFPHKFLRACLYFHPNVTRAKYHPAYANHLTLAFEVLLIAHSVLKNDFEDTVPEEQTRSNESHVVSAPPHVAVSPPVASSSLPAESWADKTIEEILQLCADYKTRRCAVPVHYMNIDQFISYCAAITKLDDEHIQSSLMEIRTLVYRYDPTSPLLPFYLQFTIGQGYRLLSSTKNGFYDHWSYHHSPLRISNHIFDLAIKAIGSSIGITEHTSPLQRYRRLCLKFHPDKISHQYHPVYKPFLRHTQSILTAAWTVIEYELDTDMPDLISSSDSDNDNASEESERPQAPPNVPLPLPFSTSTISTEPANTDVGARSEQIFIDDRLTLHPCSGDSRDLSANACEERSIFDHGESRFFLSKEHPDFFENAACSSLSQNLDNLLRDVQIDLTNTLSKLYADVPSDEMIAPSNISDNVLPQNSLSSLHESLDHLLLEIRSMRINTVTNTDEHVLRSVDIPHDTQVSSVQYTSQEVRLPVTDHTSAVSSDATQSAPQLQPVNVLSTSDKYIITFRGSAQYLAHNNFQYYTDNINMSVDDINTLITSILLNQQNCSLYFFSATCPSITAALHNPGVDLPALSRICSALQDNAIHVDALMHDSSRFLVGWFTVERVGDPPSIDHRHRTAYYFTHSWYQAVQTIGIPPRLPITTVPPNSYYRVRFARNTQVSLQDQFQHFSSTSTIYDIQTWLSEILATVYDAPMVYPETQLHFLVHHPVLASTNLSSLISGDGAVSLHVVSKSPLIHPAESHVTRIFFGQYSIEYCSPFLNGREHVHLFDRREQDQATEVRLSQADISTTVPFHWRTPGFDTDRHNFHAYVIRFCTVLPESPTSPQRSSGFESLEFNNEPGIRRLRWLISQNTAIHPRQIQFSSPIQHQLRFLVNSSRTFGDLCDIFASARADHVTVYGEPPHGGRIPLGIVTVERVGTLRPQLQPPYLSGDVRFVESYADFDPNNEYSGNLLPQILPLLSTVFEITLCLPFMTAVIAKDFPGHSTIHDIMFWTSDILSQYHMSDLALPDEQLHFTKGYAIHPNTVIGNKKFDSDQRIYILSRKSLAVPFHETYTRIMHGYYKISRKFLPSDPQSPINVPLFDNSRNDHIPPAPGGSASSETPNVVDMSSAFMYVESHAGSVRTNLSSAWPMSDSGCELTVFPTLDMFVEQIKHRTEIITAKADCRIVSEIRGTVQLPVLDQKGQQVLITLSPVLYAPECDMPLLSVDALNKQGCHVVFAPTYAGIFRESMPMIPFQKVRNMWFLPIVDNPPPFQYALKLQRPDVQTQVLWHLTLGHASPRVLYETSQISKHIPKLPMLSDHHFCPICAQSKMRARNTPPPSESRTHAPGDLMHYDICFLDKPTLHGCRMVSGFTDDCCSYKWKFLHKHRDAITIRNIFNQFLAIVQSIRLKTTGEPMRIARIRSDNGAEIHGRVMTEWTTEKLIVPETTAPDTPSQNGKAEVSGGNSCTVSRSMQITANTPDILQGYAIHYGVYIENRLFSAALSRRKGYNTSPFQELYGEPASFQNCYPFGCAAYYYLGKRHNPGWKRQARGIPSIFVGLGNWQGKKAFLLYNPLDNITVASINVKFDSNFFPWISSHYQLGHGYSVHTFRTTSAGRRHCALRRSFVSDYN